MKFLVNSTYGVNAYPSFRLYDFRVADTITYIGRTIAKYVSERVEEVLGYKVLYNDTDSVFVHVNKKDYSLIPELEKALNEFTAEKVAELSNGKASNYMKIEADKVFDKILFCEKKRYVGRMVFKDNKEVKPQMMYVGVDIKRNNIPEIIRTALKEFVNVLFEDESKAKDVVKRYIREIRQSYDIAQFKIPTKIEKAYVTNVPQQRAADFANKKWKLGFKPGSKFYSIWVSYGGTDIIGFDVDERVKEYAKYLDKQKYVDMFLQKVQLLYDIDINSLFNHKLTDYF
jgi:DNA polymerase elongation subunit (family B)